MSKGTLLPSVTAEVAVVALVGGQFVFPKNTLLVSAVYAVCVSKPLLQPLRLDIQHCVNLVRPSQTNYLKFAIAPVNTPTLPYEFTPVEGGEFTINSYYGSLYRQEFSLVSIIADVVEDDDNMQPHEDGETNGQPHIGDGQQPHEEDHEEIVQEVNGDVSTDTQDEDDTSSDSECTESTSSQTQGH